MKPCDGKNQEDQEQCLFKSYKSLRQKQIRFDRDRAPPHDSIPMPNLETEGPPPLAEQSMRLRPKKKKRIRSIEELNKPYPLQKASGSGWAYLPCQYF